MKYSQYLKKIERYCDFSDRCEFEVKTKMISLGVPLEYQARILPHLRDLKILNDERFAQQYVRGKFNSNGWGKKKIEAGLRAKKIDFDLIKKSLQVISDEDYLQYLRKLLKWKIEELEKDEVKNMKQRTFSFLYTRGFETELISKVLKEEKILI